MGRPSVFSVYRKYPAAESKKNALIVGASIARPQDVRLSEYGKIVDSAIRNIPVYYPAITVDSYTVMPNHIHLLLQINTDENGRAMLAPTGAGCY